MATLVYSRPSPDIASFNIADIYLCPDLNFEWISFALVNKKGVDISDTEWRMCGGRAEWSDDYDCY